MTELVSDSLNGLHQIGIRYIREHGEEYKDQNGDGVQACHNIHFICDSNDMHHVNMGSTTKLLDIDFGIALINPTHARIRGVGFDYGYGWRMWELKLIEKAIKMLKQNPNTRRCWIPLYRPEDVDSDSEVPCCVGFQFEIIDGRLDMTVVFRSNDCGQASPSDDYGFRMLQRWVAYRVGVSVGKYYRYVINAHLKLGDSNKFDYWSGLK